MTDLHAAARMAREWIQNCDNATGEPILPDRSDVLSALTRALEASGWREMESMSEIHDPLLMLTAWIDHWRSDVEAKLAPTIHALNSAAREIETAKSERAEILYHLDGAKRIWRPISANAKDRSRILLCWEAFSGMPAHVELGYWSDAKKKTWCNTYGESFSGEPNFYMPLPPPPQGEK